MWTTKKGRGRGGKKTKTHIAYDTAEEIAQKLFNSNVSTALLDEAKRMLILYDAASQFVKHLSNGQRTHVHLARAKAYELLKDPLKEEAEYTAAIAAGGLFVAHATRARFYHSKGQYISELKDRKCAISLKPTDSRAYEQRAIVLRILGRLDASAADCDKAIALDQSQTGKVRWGYYWTRARTEEKRGHYTSAIAGMYFVHSYDNNAKTNVLCMYTCTDYTEVDHLHQYGHHRSQLQIAICYAAMGKRQKAMPIIDRLLRLKTIKSDIQSGATKLREKILSSCDDTDTASSSQRTVSPERQQNDQKCGVTTVLTAEDDVPSSPGTL